MGLFDRFKKKEKKETINTDGVMITTKYRFNQHEYIRLTIQDMGASGIDGLDKDQLTEKLLYFYDNMLPVQERIRILMETFDIDRETAKQVEYVSFAKTSLIADYLYHKEKGATRFNIINGNRKLKSNLNIKDYVKNVGFMINNDGVPVFNIKTDGFKRWTPNKTAPKLQANTVPKREPPKTVPKKQSKADTDEIDNLIKELKTKRVTPNGMKLKKELPEVDRLATKQNELHNKLGDKNYYGSPESKEEFREFNNEVDNYLKNNPKDFITRGANYVGYKLEFIFYTSEDEANLMALLGEGLYYEQDLEDYNKAIETYRVLDRLNNIVMKDEIAELKKHDPTRDYLYSANAKQRIEICQNKIRRAEIKELEAEAKELEETNPTEAIKKYEELNKINPGLKKYDKRIYRMIELEAKELEETNPTEAIKKYEYLNEVNPGLKKYNKRIEIIKKKL